MAKIIIKNSEGMQTPFLRGILTSSLLDAGVEFNLAYELATKIRNLINAYSCMTTRVFAFTKSNSSSTFSFFIRIQPLDMSLPMESGSAVPCIP